MTFLNAILLAGASAFLIPLLIHLFNRRRVVVVRWGAMHLLHEVIRQRRRRMKIEQWLLLAVRIAIPIVLALCLARPVFTALRSFGLGKTSLVVLLDDSYSMRAAATGGSPAERARQDLTRILDELPGGSDVQVILAGGTPSALLDEPTTVTEEISGRLAEVNSLAGPVRVNDALQAAVAALGRSQNAAREVIVLSDFQAGDWQAAADGAALPALESLLQQEPVPQLTFYQMLADGSENLSLAGADLSALVLAQGQPVGVRARLRNHGAKPWQDVVVHLEADGARLRSTRVSLPANGESVVHFTHAFDSTGDHSLAVRLEGDSFVEDNAFHAVVQVRDQLNVLLVDGDPSTTPLGGAVDFLELALAPYQSASASLKDLVRTTRVEARRFRAEDLRGKEVVILADVERLQGNRLAELDAFVRGGGGLIVFAGPHCDLEWYNREFHRRGEGLYPAAIAGLQRAQGAPARILQQRLTHSAVLYFNDARGGRLQDAEFQSWFEFSPAEGVQPVLQLDRGVPLLLEKAVGRGRVLAFAATADAEWSNLPLQPFYVPLMQRLAAHLATQNAGAAWSPTGVPLRLVLPPELATAAHELRDPTGLEQTLQPRVEGGVALLETPPLRAPGIYQLSAGGRTRLFALNLDGAESDLTSLPAGSVGQIAERYQAARVDSFEAWRQLDRTRRFGSEIWQPLLLALLALLFFEVLLQQRIARG
jgi:hypothetical protein